MTALEYSEYLKSETDLEREAAIYANELEHYGVKGMRWGVRRTPEQLGHKTSKKKSLVSRVKKAVSKKTAKAKKTKEQKKEESDEEIRQKLLKSTDPKYIKKHMSLLDDKELKARLERINTENKIKTLAAEADKSKLDQFMKKFNKTTTYMNDVAKFYNSDAGKLIRGAVSSAAKNAEKSKDSSKDQSKSKDKKNDSANRTSSTSTERTYDPLTGIVTTRNTRTSNSGSDSKTVTREYEYDRRTGVVTTKKTTKRKH